MPEQIIMRRKKVQTQQIIHSRQQGGQLMPDIPQNSYCAANYAMWIGHLMQGNESKQS